jgi:hypothetical protein
LAQLVVEKRAAERARGTSSDFDRRLEPSVNIPSDAACRPLSAVALRGMWISCLRWRPIGGEVQRRGRSWNAFENDAVTADAGTELLRGWMSCDSETLQDAGDLFLEIVEASAGDRSPLQAVLVPVFGDRAAQAAEYLTMEDPINTFSVFTVRDGAVDDESTIRFEAVDWVDMQNDERAHGDPILVVRPLRVVGRRGAVVIVWDQAGGYPRAPDPRLERSGTPRGLPARVVIGEAEQACTKGEPEWLVELAYGMGSAGPARIPQLVSEWEKQRVPAGALGDRILSSCVDALDQVAMRDLPTAMDGWESSLLERTRSAARGTRRQVSTLADLGGMVGLLGQAARAISEPSGSDPDYYFAPTAESSSIEERAGTVLRAVQGLRERVRTALALVSAVSTSEALEVARETQASGEQFQRAVGIFGAVILGPTLVVGLFGANVSVPGEGKWWGFALMMGLMVISAIALLALLRRATRSPTRSGTSD